MYELTVAFKYLVPRWRQLSVSIISLISTVVIALVVWLIVVFFSVTHGLQNSWIEKIIALSAPVKIIPTKEYYNSFYYLSDSISESTHYSFRSIGERRESSEAIAYNPEIDEQTPSHWPPPDTHPDGTVKNLVKEVFDLIAAMQHIPGIHGSDYEMAVGNLHLRVVKETPDGGTQEGHTNIATYLSSFEKENKALAKSLIDVNLEKEELIAAHADGILLPKNFKKLGVAKGDTGYISYQTATTSSVQEQRIPIFVAGFYDPGIISMGDKFILTNKEVVSLIRSSYEQHGETIGSNGIHVRFDTFNQAEKVKEFLVDQLKKRGIDKYWKVETFQEYDFSRDLIQQLKSERFLFTLLATIIIIVACSNIISMLIILVNDKRTEIGILRAMGSSSKSIAMIFGVCGAIMGLLGSIIGIVLAKLTLTHLDKVISFMSAVQGHQMFNPLFFGEKIPSEISYGALSFVLISTALISLIAGIVPAIKASTVNPASILRTE